MDADVEMRERVRPFLYAGEQLVAVCSFELGPGVPAPPASLLAPAQPSQLQRRIEEKLPRPLRRLSRSRLLDPRRSRPAAAADAVDRLPDAVDDLGTRLMHGTNLEGGWQSLAGKFVVALADARGSATGSLLAVTDRSWLALADVSALWQSTPVMRQAWQAPRQAVAALRANPQGVLQRRRMDLEFTDGSWVALLASAPSEAAAFAAEAVRYR
ncbi:hypothetical protein [Streptomyces sp. WAC06614]|uniref:hypothetical protein n=1 Tax=Streptomyces sp. WAC06614 TaxID=2487416 RepID=UPI000F780ED3|nr:hypothetical protein [Streptomyces sp. WAC06614]RSS78578.1 hypothetical protein EF918_20390 [Streptomyces sp. WAC06614]